MLVTILLLVICSISTIQSEDYYKCDFEESCEDIIFDSYWIVNNVSSHADHTYGNLSGHYISYTELSVSNPLTTFRTRDWVDVSANSATCFTQWIYSAPGAIKVRVDLAQGDDLQARNPVGFFGMSGGIPQWEGVTLELPHTDHFIPIVAYTNITGSLDLDDVSFVSCGSTKPIPPVIKALQCDFDRYLCFDLFSFSNYSYSWSIIKAQEAQSYATTAPAVDYSVGDQTGHYIWLNNSDSLVSGGAGYLSTPVFRFTRSDPMFCLSFQYYRFGPSFQTSKLTVLALQEGDGKSVEQVWPINPINYTYINNRWSWAYAPLLIGNYSLLFRMDSDYEVSSSFAIDSISVSSCGYPQNYYYATSRLEFACDFDSSCDIRDDYTDLDPKSVINYTIVSPRSIRNTDLGPKQSTGWSGDYFLYWSRSIDTSLTLINGQFKTSLIETNRDVCIRFAYFVNSTDVEPDENNTELQVFTHDCHIETLWSIKLDNSFGWQLVTQSLHPTACRQSIYFRITQKRPTRVAVAFDDITIAPCGTLNVLTTTQSPPTTTTPFNKSPIITINYILLITILLMFPFLNMHF